MSDADKYRLPTNVKPTHYDLTIKTDLDELTFQGVVKVSIDVKDDTTSITFNSAGLELSKAAIYSEALSTELPLAVPEIDEAHHRVTYHLPKGSKLPAGSKAHLKVLYKAKLTGALTGYFKCSWVDGGKSKDYAVTQFQPISARRAFPSWDEPLLKATFSVSMVSRAKTTNLGNMPAVSERVITPGQSLGEDIDPEFEQILFTDVQGADDQWKLTKFDKTPLMSTYLVAFANGEFAFLEDFVVLPLSGKTVPLRVYATKDGVAQAQYTLDIKKAVLPLYEEVFDVEYPLPKLDTLIAHDFLGAMENWGLIIGSANFLPIDPKRGSVKEKKGVMRMESHEVAHMWFGNITTLEWWNYLYLHEGFATLMGEVVVPNKLFPEWRLNTEFIVKHLSAAMSIDSKLSSHPVEVDIPDANRISEIFDSLSYSKAASVMRMLSAYVGEDNFLKGVSIYLKKNLFGNSRTHDLWDGISEATGLDIPELMENWIVKMGFPVLKVTEADSEHGAKGIVVRQERFLETGSAEGQDNETIWNVPLAILSIQDGTVVVDNEVVLREREKFFPLDTSKPYKLNAGTNGFYRVLYSPERFAQIAAETAKAHSVFSLDDKLALLLDSIALSKAGLAKLSSALKLVEQLQDDKEYLIWLAIADSLGSLISTWWEHPEILDKLNEFRRSLFAPFVDKLGYDYPEGEDVDKALLRTLVIGQASAAGDERVNKELRSRFNHFLETGDDSKVPVALQADIFTAAVRYGGRKEYEAMYKTYDSPKTAQEKNAAIRGLCSPQNEFLLKETFNFLSTKARNADFRDFFGELSNNFKARRPLTKYMEDRYDVIYDRYQAGFLLRLLIPAAVDYYSSKEDLAAIQAFFKDKDTSKYSQTLGQALDNIRAKIGLIERSTDDLNEWLAGRR